jgi:hypothetical protein
MIVRDARTSPWTTGIESAGGGSDPCGRHGPGSAATAWADDVRAFASPL